MHAVQQLQQSIDLFTEEILVQHHHPISPMSFLRKLVKNPARKHYKTKFDPELGTYYCPCDYHEQEQEKKRQKQAARGVQNAVNYYDRDAYVNRETYYSGCSSHDYSQTHDHEYHHCSQEPGTCSSQSPEPEPEPEPEPQPGMYLTWKPEVEQESQYSTESEYHSAHENDNSEGNRRDENTNTRSWRYGDVIYGDRDQWEANSSIEFYKFMGWS